MSSADDACDPQDRHICHACVGEECLSDRIKRTGTAVECADCGEIDMCWTIEDLADQVETAFESHYIRTSEDDGEPVLDAIESAANISREVAGVILTILQDRHYDHEAAKMGEESEFASDSYYA